MIMEKDKILSQSKNIDEKQKIFREIRTFGINIPILKSMKFEKKQGYNEQEYLFVSSFYDRELGLIISNDYS